MSKNITGEDVMYAILANKNAKYSLIINGQLNEHLTPTECIDFMEEAISQFANLNDNIQQPLIDLTQYATCFTMVFTGNTEILSLTGRKE